MKKIIVILLVFVMCFSVAVLSGCNSKEVKKSTTQLDISSYIDDYNEEEIREQFKVDKDICLVKDQATNYSVIVPNNSSELFFKNASDFVSYLNKIVDKDIFSLENETSLKSKNFISLGNTNLSNNIDMTSVENDGYVIKTHNNNIFIKGNSEESSINGMYGFLESYLEVMFVRSDYTYTPYLPTIYLDEINIVDNPYFMWRNQYQHEVYSTDWSYKLRLNGNVSEGEWSPAHSSFTYVDPDIYFEDHPEYFSKRGFKRVPEQLCLSNPEIVPLIEDGVRKMIEENPNYKYIDFSIMDNLHYCQCKDCKELYKKYDSKVGSILVILNHLARTFPDKIFTTLAYTYNEDPPKNIELEDNIIIKLCPIKSGQLYSHAFSGNSKAKNTNELVSEWGKYAKNLYIWDYVVNYEHTLLPYPNLEVQKDNLIFYKENNVNYIFHQGMYSENCELTQIRSYIMAKQLWDPNIDINKTLAKYLNVTYGNADKYVAKYLDLSHKYLREDAKDLDLYDKPQAHSGDYLSNKAISEYMEIINNAINTSRLTNEELYRLEEIKINILYAKMYESSFDFKGKEQAFSEFSELVKKHNIDRVNEWKKPSMDEFLNSGYESYLVGQKLILSSIVILPFVVVGLITLSIVLILKYKKKKRLKSTI